MDKICPDCMQAWPGCLCIRGVQGWMGIRPIRPIRTPFQLHWGPVKDPSAWGTIPDDTKEICTKCYRILANCTCPREGV